MGRDTFLTVRREVKNPERVAVLERQLKLVEQTGDKHQEAVAFRRELKSLVDYPEDEDYPPFQPIVTIIKENALKTVPATFKNFHTKVGTPEVNMKLGKELITALFDTAKKEKGVYVPMMVPPPIFLPDKAIKQKIVWQDMVIVDEDKWEERPIVEEVLELQPSLVTREELDDEQLARYEEMLLVAEVAEFMYFWGAKGRHLEVTTEIVS